MSFILISEASTDTGMVAVPQFIGYDAETPRFNTNDPVRGSLWVPHRRGGGTKRDCETTELVVRKLRCIPFGIVRDKLSTAFILHPAES